jgi:hypothetical protein
MRNKLEEEKKKVRITLTIDPEINKIIEDNCRNRSRYIENLIYVDLLKNNLIKEGKLL